MSTRRVTLRRQAEGCPVCGSAKAKIGASRNWNQHKIGPGYDDGHRYGTEGAKPHCPASGKDQAQVDDLLRAFESWDNPGGIDVKGMYHRQMTVSDNADSIILTARLRLGDGDEFATPVQIHPDDTLRLIDELTAIAMKRGLI